ncbi:MAG: hypothetical protein ACO3Y3_08420 [Phycisphaerales bacterium]
MHALPSRTGSLGTTGLAGAVAWIAMLLAASSAPASPQGPLPPLGGSPELPIATEAFPLTREDLASRAEVIVHGTVESISIVRDVTNRFDERSFTAILLVDRVERGDGVAPGDRVAIEYWRRQPLVEGASDSVGGYAPLPWQGETAWVFARGDVENPERLIPLLPNGWAPDADRPMDPEGTFGGRLDAVRDERTASLLPWSAVAIAASVVIGIASMKAGPQSRGAMLLLAAGLMAAGVALAFW